MSREIRIAKASGAVIATGQSGEFTCPRTSDAAHIFVDVTVVAGTDSPTLTVSLQAKDPLTVSGLM